MTKSHKLLVLSVLFPITDVPDNHQVLRRVLVLAAKPKASGHDVSDLRIMLCANGETQSADVEDSYSPVCLAFCLRINILIAASFNSSLSLLDVVNAYQNTILTE